MSAPSRRLRIVAERDLSLTYSGVALDDGRMDVRDLAPALLSLGEIFQEANALTDPSREPVSLQIKATERGSFEVALLLYQQPGLVGQFVHFLSNDDATALANLIAYVTGATASLFWLVKKLHNRRLHSQEQLAPGTQRIVLDDGSTFDIPSVVLDLYRSPTVRRNLRNVVAPLVREGVSRLEITDGPAATVVEDFEAEAFLDLPVSMESEIVDRQSEMAVTIVAVSFAEGNKWRLSDGVSTFYAAIEDGQFLGRVDSGESFRKGDVLRCVMRLQQWQTESGLRAEWSVLRVIEHLPANRAVQLPFEIERTREDAS